MLVGMDSSPDFDRAEVLRRALRAVRTQFPEPDGPRPDPPDPRRPTGRATVLIGFGEHVDDANFVMLTVPDAHELVRRVQSALDAALPAVGR
jgi:hypothetical protein